MEVFQTHGHSLKFDSSTEVNPGLLQSSATELAHFHEFEFNHNPFENFG